MPTHRLIWCRTVPDCHIQIVNINTTVFKPQLQPPRINPLGYLLKFGVLNKRIPKVINVPGAKRKPRGNPDTVISPPSRKKDNRSSAKTPNRESMTKPL